MVKGINLRMLCFVALIAALATGCTTSSSHTPQMTEMPEGPLQSYRYQMASRVNRAILTDVYVWHDDSTHQGLLTLEGDESPLVAGMEIPQPINVVEEVFDSLYRIIADARLFELDTHYGKTYFVDAYAYPAWNLVAEFADVTIISVSEGEEPVGGKEGLNRVTKFLTEVARAKGLEWLVTQPIDLNAYDEFADMGTLLVRQEDEGRGDSSMVFERKTWPTEELQATIVLMPDGQNRYKEKGTGNTWELKWVEDELTLVCRSPQGKPLYATMAHTGSLLGWDWDMKVYHLLTGSFTDDQGRSVTLKRSGSVKGLLGKDEESLHLRNYHGRPAFRFVVGDYPDERYYGFVPTADGLDIYDTKAEPDSDDDDRVLTTKICHLKRTGESDYQWLHSELLDSYYVAFFSPAERVKMLGTVEKPDVKTSQDEWNAWVLRTF